LERGTSSSCPTAQSGKESHSRVVVKLAAHMPCSEFPYEFCGCLLRKMSCIILGCSASGARRGQRHSSRLCDSLSLAFSPLWHSKLGHRKPARSTPKSRRKGKHTSSGGTAIESVIISCSYILSKIILYTKKAKEVRAKSQEAAPWRRRTLQTRRGKTRRKTR
jgi:hypothetical protein